MSENDDTGESNIIHVAPGPDSRIVETASNARVTNASNSFLKRLGKAIDGAPFELQLAALATPISILMGGAIAIGSGNIGLGLIAGGLAEGAILAGISQGSSFMKPW